MTLKKRRAPLRKRRKSAHHYFVPSHHNDYQPQYLAFQSIAINIAIVILLFLIALGVQSLVFRSPSSQVGAVVASVLVDLANTDRSGEGLASLTQSETLQKAAQMKADDMAAKSYFAHQSPDGKSPWHWFKQAGYTFRFAGENLAVYFSDSSELEKAWMNSPLHRANIMNSRFTEVGIALAHGTYEGYDTTYVVQMFGSSAQEAGVAVTSSSPEAEGSVAGASAEALDVIMEDDTFIAVEREGEPIAAVSDMQPLGAVKGSPSPVWKLLSSPKTTLQYIYMVMAAIIILALVLLVSIEFRRLHVPSLVRGIFVLALIGTLFFGGFTYFSGTLLIV